MAEAAAATLDDLASRLRGEVLGPDEPGYDDARQVWNGMIDRRPAAIARCAGADDVAAAVGFARQGGLPLAVRGGGHGVAGHAVCDGGVVIDLSEMNDVSVDPDRRVARAGGGCTLGDLDGATQRHGLATPLGVVTETGIAGLTLSGGIGWLRRRHGLSCDNVVAAEVVTADGSILTASEHENADLFWAIRGGGGNFGVVTSLEYRLHPVGPEVFVCFVFYPAGRASEVLRSCQDFIEQDSDGTGPIAFFGRVPATDEFPAEQHGEPYLTVLAVHAGDASDGERALAPLRELGDPIADLSGAMPYTEAQAVLDEDYPDGWCYYWKSINVRDLGSEVVEALTERAAAAPSPQSTIDIWFQGGAMAEVGETETAFGNRDAPYLLGIEGNWEDDSASEENVAWVRDTVAAMQRFSDGGVYLNFPGFLEEGRDLVREGYGANYERLAEVKAKYDPENLFRLNANVEPRS